MIRDFRTNIGLEFYVDEVLEFSFNGDYYAFYQPEYDHLVIRSKNQNLTVFRYNEASTITLDGIAFVDIQNQLNDILNTLGGSGGGVGTGITTVDNGLTESPAGNAQWGGTLLADTAVEAGEFNLMLRGVNPFGGRDARIAINATSAAAKMASDSDGIHIGWDAAINQVLIQSGILDNVTITNDGTNNIILAPTSLDVNHNTLIQVQFNDGAGIVSTLSMNNAETSLNFTDAGSGSVSQHSLNNTLWTASYQSANLSRVQLDDAQAAITQQSGATAELSRVILETNQYTIDNTDGALVASIVGRAVGGITALLTDIGTGDYSRARVEASGVELKSEINGGNLSVLTVNPDIIFAEGGVGFGFISVVLSNTTLTAKKTLYFIDTTGAAGSFTLVIPTENCMPGYIMTIKDSIGNASLRTINIDTATGQMELGLTQTINTDFGYMTFVYDGTTWLTIAQG